MRDVRQILTTARRFVLGEPGTVPIAYFRKFLPRDPVIVEAGAHNGSDTVRLARAWPAGQVHAFEPVPRLYETMSARMVHFANVFCHAVALGESPGTATIFVSSGASDGSSSLLQPSGHLAEHPNVNFTETLTVQVTTLDGWADRERVSRVDFLWLDLQGGELAALRGAHRVLAGVQVVYTEVSLKPMYDGAPLYPELRAWMADAGFSVVREELPWPDMGNVVFARVDRASSRR